MYDLDMFWTRIWELEEISVLSCRVTIGEQQEDGGREFVLNDILREIENRLLVSMVQSVEGYAGMTLYCLLRQSKMAAQRPSSIVQHDSYHCDRRPGTVLEVESLFEC